MHHHRLLEKEKEILKKVLEKKIKQINKERENKNKF